MTNQQGAPEALRLADWLKNAVATYPQVSEDEPGGYCQEVDQVMDEAAAELRRLHAENERLAALVEAQQPATVQPVAQQGAATNDADAEEVDAVIACLGDDAATLREQNPECEMAANMDRAAELLALRTQQPAPSAAEIEGGPPGSGGWEKHAIEMERQRDYYRQRCHTMEEHQNGGVWYWQGDDGDSLESMGNSMLVVIRADQLRSLMQPSPTAQADSQPAPEYVGNGMFKGETIQKAAEHWANWCDVRCLTGLSEFLRVVAATPAFWTPEEIAAAKESAKKFEPWLADADRAARAPADSVTAPAGGVVEYTPMLDDEGRMMVGASHHYTAENIRALVAEYKALEAGAPEALERYSNSDHRTRAGVLWRVISALADEVPFAQPAKAADSVQDLQPVHDAVTIDLLNERVAYLERKLKEADSVLEDADPIRALIAEHAAILDQNESAYFELCYHRATGWMAWITDKPLCMPPVVNPDRKVLAQGQGDTADEACRDAARKQGDA